jgi:hypothetical protein
VIRTLESEDLNRIANDPEVRPWLGGEGFIDLTEIAANPDNICLLTPNRDGAYVLHKLQSGMYEAHSLALETARGKPMLTLMRDGFRWMFTATDALEICTKCPDGNPAAARWADLAGFRETFRREGAFDGRGVSYRTLHYPDWILKDRRNQKEGERFHEVLEALRPHSHADDPAHDFWVGATVEGCRRGNISKAVAMYNRWAVFAGYMQSTILSVMPPVANIGDAVVHLMDEQVQVLRLL